MSYIARDFSIELYFFTAEDVNPDNMTVNATLIEGGKYIKKSVPLPKIVYNDFSYFKYNLNNTEKELRSIIRKESFLFRKGLIETNEGLLLNKQRIYNILVEGGQFKEYLIDTHTVESFDQLISLLEKYNNDVVIKPTNGMTGADVIRITSNTAHDYLLTCKDGNLSLKNINSESPVCGNYLLTCKDGNLSLKDLSDTNPSCGYILSDNKRKIFLKNTDELQNYYDKYIAQNDNKLFLRGKNILQPYIVSRTKNGNPFDIRIHVTRASKGQFKAFPYARIGVSSKGLVSNVSAGGYSMLALPFLKGEFGEDSIMLYNKLMYLGNNLPYHFQSFFKKKCFAMGIDVGIQRREGSYELKIFELNVGGPNPVGSPIEIELAFANLEYMQYLGECLANGTLNNE